MKKISLRNGYSVIELLIVLALLIFLLSLFSRSNFRISLLHHELVLLHMRAAHLAQSAMITGNQEVLSFDLVDQTYTHQGMVHALPRNVRFGCISGVKGPPSKPMHEIADPISFKDHQIIFNPSGVAQSGTVYLVDDAQQHLYALTIPVGPISHIRAYRYDKKWCLI